MAFDLKKPIDVDIRNQAAVVRYAQELINEHYQNPGKVTKVVVMCQGRELFVQMTGGDPECRWARHCFEDHGWDFETIEDCKSMADILQCFGYGR
jgi:hypothetical protein